MANMRTVVEMYAFTNLKAARSKKFFKNKKAVGVCLPLVLILAVSVYIIGTVSRENPDTVLSKPGLRIIKRSISLSDDLNGALRAAAAEDAPAYVKNHALDKRFLPAIANLAGDIVSSGSSFDADELTDTIQKLGSMKNMGPDIMAQSVQNEAEVTAEVEKEVAEETVDKILGKYSHDKKDEDGDDDDNDGGGGGEHEIKAEVDFVADKGMVEDDMFAPPGMHMKVDVEEDPGTDSEPDQSSEPMAFSYPLGMGSALMNGCFGTGYVPGDPCYNVRDVIPACYNMMEGCGYIGVGFDGRGDYSSTSRKKTVVQRNCKNLATYHDEDVPDTMNVHGIFDTEVSSYVFESRQTAVESAYGKSTSSNKQKFMSLMQCNVIRYEIFLDEISPDTLSLPFLRDFLSLPTNFILGRPQLQKFIIRYGTHFIKSAKFGGSFRLFKTQEASRTESLEDFSIQAQASYNSLFFNAGGHAGMSSSSGSSQSSKSSSTHVTVEGGDQEVASIVADFYSTGFKDTFTEWLKSIPTYPKPIEMFMGTMSELLDLNYKLLFPFDIKDAADGCFGAEYCDFTSADKFEQEMDKKRLALERAIAVYMEEGPVPTTDFRLEGGDPGCTSEALGVKGGASGTTYPTWMELISGDTYKIIFDLPESINYDISKDKEAFLVFARQRWNCHAPGAKMHMYNSRDNGGSGDINNKKVSCFGFVMTYQEASGTFVVTQQDQDASTQALGQLRRSYVGWTVARAEYVSPLEHAQAKGDALSSIVEAPCSVKWSNSYQIKPAEEGGRCLYFVAASAGDIFVVFSTIPRDVSTWYHLQISYQGVALYKGMKLVKYEGAKNARSLGDSKLFQPYFICLEEDAENMRTYIKYGVGSDTSEKGLVYMVYNDRSPPLGIRFYSFGSGEESVEIMDARVIEGGATGQMECTGGTVLKDGICVEDCHPECDGCIPSSPGSKLDTECRRCKHFSIKIDKKVQCVAECPAGQKPGADGVECTCKDFVISHQNGTNTCVSACPLGNKVGSDGNTCLCKFTICLCTTPWRDDWRCGKDFPAQAANPGRCNPFGPHPCCSDTQYCGRTDAHCTCSGCRDYRNLALGKPAYQSSQYTDHVAGRAVDGVTSTCAHTVGGNGEPYPSWWVDLGHPYLIDRVIIYIRMNHLAYWINPFNIHIGNSTSVDKNPKCGGDHRIDVSKPSISISCPGMRGRYVGVRLPGNNRILVLCEVQVFGKL
ncbi:PREDICTED: uncharacterized protein LOC109465632 [Branchiostoma belcheri]|uniref:Uncharacterized protein LOC109465632 n=1 Tax=Branchiostoma belcheri TaxID=7741 RepID=A0A6P4YIM3_BRABE|nr:PREDICTED: uncharacterized protein LOC109465632 [Branchiostoma belcheri]